MNPRDSLYLRYLLIAFAVMLALVIPTFFLTNNSDTEQTISNPKELIAPILLFVGLCILFYWIIKSLRKVGAEQIGCVLEFGRPVFEAGPGLCFVPYWFCELRKETRLAIEEQFPEDDPKKSPIRITHGTTSQLTGDPLDTRLTTSVSLTARYKIDDYVSFIQEIGNRWELKKQIRDVLVNTAAIECAKFTLAINLERRSELNHLLTVAVQKLTANWGIEILNVQLQEIDLGNEIDKAQTNVSVSAINIAANKNNAQKILFDGAAEAEVHKMFQFAKAEGIKEIAAKLGVDDKAAIYQIETLANVWRKSNADLNLYGSDVQQLFGMLTTLYKSKVDSNNNLKQNNAQQ